MHHTHIERFIVGFQMPGWSSRLCCCHPFLPCGVPVEVGRPLFLWLRSSSPQRTPIGNWLLCLAPCFAWSRHSIVEHTKIKQKIRNGKENANWFAGTTTADPTTVVYEHFAVNNWHTHPSNFAGSPVNLDSGISDIVNIHPLIILSQLCVVML